MKLFEVKNGYCGESYVRVYVWAESLEQAISLGKAALAKKYPDQNDSSIEAVELFDSSNPPFVSKPSNCGFEL